ncbi:MAG: hypothetical protein R6V58_04935 [Planctomycetota bacterium]
MKVAIVSESPADEAAVRILAEAVLDTTIETVPVARRAGGVDSALSILKPALYSAHYQQTADGVILVVDSNNTPVHSGPVDGRCERAERCRLCRARQRADEVLAALSPVPGRQPVRVAVGLAVPAIEAWYLCGSDPHVSEAAWTQGQAESRPPYTRAELKQKVYGTDRASLELETQKAVEEMTRLVQDLDALRSRFPVGFGALEHDLGPW